MKKLVSIIFIFLLINNSHSQEQQPKYWIFLNDKGLDSSGISVSSLMKRQLISERALKRRAKVLSSDKLLDESDLPVYQPYIDTLENQNIEVISNSKWLNAVVAPLSEQQKINIFQFAFVKKIQPVARYKRKNLSFKSNPPVLKNSNILDYGNSYLQNETIHVPRAHQLGVDGSGVLVGLLDSGFDYDEHEAFAHLNVVAEYDFIFDDDVTENEVEDYGSQDSHGTKVLSLIAGFKEGKLIGPAYNAQYLLGKTEYISDETIQEEYDWVEGLEWMESMGVDLVSSSLGYMDWYDYSDMDGKTAITTIAAEKAVQKGVVVVISMGNERNNSWQYMIAPADGENVISVGSVTGSGQLSYFSSIGPTYDGRTKPDVVAMGQQIWYAMKSKVGDYANTSVGTSFSAPQVAGVTAMILCAHPYLTPYQVREALRETACNAADPNNDIGWGVVNAYDAIFYYGLFFSNQPKVGTDELGHFVKTNIFTQYEIISDSLFMFYRIGDNPEFVKIPLQSTDIENEYQAHIPLQQAETEIQLYFTAADKSGDSKRHPFYAPEDYFFFNAYDTTVNPHEEPRLPEKFTLYQNYPNPFNNQTIIRYDIFESGDVELEIFNIRGQLIKTLVNRYQIVNTYFESWDGTNNSGHFVASGVYFYRLKINQFVKHKKMLLLH